MRPGWGCGTGRSSFCVVADLQIGSWVFFPAGGPLFSPNVIPTAAARFSLSRRIMARRAAEWRDLSANFLRPFFCTGRSRLAGPVLGFLFSVAFVAQAFLPVLLRSSALRLLITGHWSLVSVPGASWVSLACQRSAPRSVGSGRRQRSQNPQVKKPSLGAPNPSKALLADHPL